ncbi:alpha/beta hydrolase [Pseudomonas knackmussii]|uniref:Alpha/beta hydrolase n=1 Tax=Pseudomonas knackmussii TaxID=65741 RepID=A0ABY4KT91_9PSED|nr:alpha/beta hydrolase [Pseudomonas knackmussii]UPQ84072.1 alpha/beta hydrolase [Pseudomonas knackmussii]
MFEQFKLGQRDVNGVTIHYRQGGSGPPLLLLHGYPQTHVMWHKIADQLAERFTVVAADLRGYGDSSKPEGGENHVAYSKREMARDQVELMQALGFERFDILAHDRGARVSHRLAMDHPQVVRRMILLDIAPTLAMYSQTNETFARAYWHWFFLIRPAPIPESLLALNPEQILKGAVATRPDHQHPFSDAAFAEYLRCMKLPGTIHAFCEDYRASAGIDLEHDREDRAAGRMIQAPLLVLWGADGIIERCFDPMKEWRAVAQDVQGKALPAGHYLPEEVPERVLEEALAFLAR